LGRNRPADCVGVLRIEFACVSKEGTAARPRRSDVASWSLGCPPLEPHQRQRSLTLMSTCNALASGSEKRRSAAYIGRVTSCSRPRSTRSCTCPRSPLTRSRLDADAARAAGIPFCSQPESSCGHRQPRSLQPSTAGWMRPSFYSSLCNIRKLEA
jgi:hypothetical protein